MEELRLKQINEDTNLVKANNSNDHQIFAHEKHLMHVSLEIVDYNRQGQKLSTPFVQIFRPEEFEASSKAGHFNGYEVVILHDPANNSKEEEFVAPPQTPLVLPNPAPATTDINTSNDPANKEQGGAPVDTTNPVVDKVVEPNTEGTQGSKTPAKDPLPSMDDLMENSRDQLQVQYEELYGEKPKADLKKADLAEAIIEKLQFNGNEGF